MPIYEYKCKNCGTATEVLVGDADRRDDIVCPQCGSNQFERLMSSSFSVGRSRERAAKNDSCCGSHSPCENPKKCCAS